MTAAGDISTVLTLDDFEYMTGLRDAAGAARQFSKESEGLLGGHHSLHRAAHKATHLAMAASFATTAGEADGLVGGLEKAAMLAPMIGMQFGPIGAAIGVTGGILATAFLGPMKAAEESAKRFGEEVLRAGERWSKVINQHGQDVLFERKLGRMDANTSPEAIRSQMEEKQDEAAAKRAMLEESRSKQQALLNAVKPPHAATGGGGAGSLIEDIIGGAFGTGAAGAVHEAIGDQIGQGGIELSKETQEAIRKAAEEVRELEEGFERAESQAEQLGEALEQAEEGAARKKEEQEINRQYDERLALAKKIGDEVLTPLEKAKQKQEELETALFRGVIDQDTFDKASAKNQKDLAKGLETEEGHRGHNAALRAGSSEAYSAIRESVKEMQGHNRPEVALLKDLANTAKQQLAVAKAEKKAGGERGGAVPEVWTIP